MDIPDEPIDEQYRVVMKVLADSLQQVLAPNGFALLMFDMTDAGRVNYISNCDRADVLKAMQAFLARNPSAMH